MLCWIEVDLDAIADNVRALQAAALPESWKDYFRDRLRS